MTKAKIVKTVKKMMKPEKVHQVSLNSYKRLKPVGTANYKHTRDGVRIRHEEYVAQLTSSSSTAVFNPLFGEPVNPGNGNLFPWLSTVATRYEKWKIQSLVVEYIHTANATESGNIVLYFDYDCRDTQGDSLQQVLNMYKAKPTAIFEDASLAFDKKTDALKNYYVSEATKNSINNISKDSHPAWLYISGNNIAQNRPLGLLRIKYDIELSVPQIQTGSLSNTNTAFKLGGKQSTMELDCMYTLPPGDLSPGVGFDHMNSGLARWFNLLTGDPENYPNLNSEGGADNLYALSNGKVIPVDPYVEFGNAERNKSSFAFAITEPGTYLMRATFFGERNTLGNGLDTLVEHPFSAVSLGPGGVADVDIRMNLSVSSDIVACRGTGNESYIPSYVGDMLNIVALVRVGPSAFTGCAGAIGNGILDGIAVQMGFDVPGVNWYTTAGICRFMTMTVVRTLSQSLISYFSQGSILPTMFVRNKGSDTEIQLSKQAPVINNFVRTIDPDGRSGMRSKIICREKDSVTSKINRNYFEATQPSSDPEGNLLTDRKIENRSQVRFSQ
jgi:hypothetical protein